MSDIGTNKTSNQRNIMTTIIDCDKKMIEFPTIFSIKVVGMFNDEFIRDVLSIAENEFHDFDAAAVERKPSSNGKYISLTIKGTAKSQEHLDGIYKLLTSHPHSKFVL